MTTEGVLLVDKPGGMTSHAAVIMVKRAMGIHKVGHAGTLDPMATGLLVLGIGRGTRLLRYFVGLDKCYVGVVRLGIGTDTLDGDGVVTVTPGCASDAPVHAAAASFVGTFSQRPPAVSAIKVDGRRAYERVRAGEHVEVPERTVTVSQCSVERVVPTRAEGISCLDVTLRAQVSSGTYIRALARDLGLALGTAGHLIGLRRTRVGPFDVTDAKPPLDQARNVLSPSAAMAHVMPTVGLAGQDAGRVRHGVRIAAGSRPEGPHALLDAAGDLLAVAVRQGGCWHYDVVMVGPD